MKRGLIKRGVIALLLLAGLALVTVRRELAATAGTKSPASSQTTSGHVPRHSQAFSQAYEICAEDGEGRPLVVHRKKLVFLFPDSAPEVNDRTFIESGECR